MSLERSRDYMNARRVAKELEIVTKGLNRNLPAIPPTLTKEEVKQVHKKWKWWILKMNFKMKFFWWLGQVELWKKYIGFEKSNPLRSEDTALVTRRVMFATEQCLLVLTHHPAVWHQAAQYLDQSSKLLTEKGVRILNIFCFSIKFNHTTWMRLTVKYFWWKLSLNKSKMFNAIQLCVDLFNYWYTINAMNVTFLWFLSAGTDAFF